MMILAMAAAIAELTISGPAGPLAATLTDPGRNGPAVILVPGSGPTDRDGNNPLGVAGGIYRQLAEQLSVRGIATLRIDKRGMFGSKKAIADPNKVSLADYAADVHGWAALLRARGKPCAWIAGHSEGGLVALVAAQEPADICGLILLAAPGRPLGAVLREQLKPKLPAEMYADAEAAIVRLEHRQPVDPATVPSPIAPLFNPAVQAYLTEMVVTDPAKLAAATRLPMLIVQGDADLQVSIADARTLAAARPDATLTMIDGINHLWKPATAGDAAANLATYSNADLSIDSRVAETIASFVSVKR